MEIFDFMKQIWNRYKLPIIFLVTAGLAFPFILNWLVLLKTEYPTAGSPETWIAFWPSYLSAIASFGMIALTAMALFYNNKTLANNKEQLNELKRQWEEEHKPNVSVTFGYIGSTAYLRIVNTSKVEIKDLKIKGDFFIGDTKNDYFGLEILERFNIDIEPGGVRNVVLNNNIAPLTEDCYFILKLYYNGGETKEIKVYCNNIYLVGDGIVWNQLIMSIGK